MSPSAPLRWGLFIYTKQITLLNEYLWPSAEDNLSEKDVMGTLSKHNKPKLNLFITKR
jgi:hypothetical protein